MSWYAPLAHPLDVVVEQHNVNVDRARGVFVFGTHPPQSRFNMGDGVFA
jgi:hypothetical protein